MVIFLRSYVLIWLKQQPGDTGWVFKTSGWKSGQTSPHQDEDNKVWVGSNSLGLPKQAQFFVSLLPSMQSFKNTKQHKATISPNPSRYMFPTLLNIPKFVEYQPGFHVPSYHSPHIFFDLWILVVELLLRWFLMSCSSFLTSSCRTFDLRVKLVLLSPKKAYKWINQAHLTSFLYVWHVEITNSFLCRGLFPWTCTLVAELV